MTELKLARLPDRTPVKITVTLPPDLNLALRQYAEIYRATYSQTESVPDLIPFMLGAFLDSDRAFAKARKDGMPDVPLEAPARRRGRKASPAPAPVSASAPNTTTTEV
nr:DUF2274 domain-containing protein [uncultured Acidocella sp.]